MSQRGRHETEATQYACDVGVGRKVTTEDIVGRSPKVRPKFPCLFEKGEGDTICGNGKSILLTLRT